jgi:hypothetical protein
MPPAVPLIAAAAGAWGASAVGSGLLAGGLFGGLEAGLINAGIGFSFAGASSFIGSAAGFVVSTAIDAVGSRLFAQSKPQAAAVLKPGIMVRETLETHKIVYGTQKISGPIVFIATTDSVRSGTNGFVHIVIALTGHEVDSIGTIFFNENPITLNSSGFANSAPYWSSGTPNAQAISTSVRNEEVLTVTTTGSHGFTAGDLVVLSGQSDGSMDGGYIIATVPSGTTFTVANGGQNSSGTGGTATDNTNLSDTNGYVRVKTHTGSATQAADTDLMAEIPGWDSSHTLSGIAYVYVRLEYNPTAFGQGIPNISAVVNGKQVYDPRSSTTAFSSNVALCIRDYLTSDYGFNCATAEINDTYVSAAANHCDESVTLTTGGSQNRYTANGVLDTAQAPIDNLNSLVAAMAGTVTYVQGQFRPYAGVYDSTVGDLDTTMLAGTVKVHTRTTRQQLFNAVQGTYVDPSLNYQATDFPQVVNSTYTANDGGTQIFKDIQLPFTNHPEAAQRIAKVILEQGRQGIMLELTLNHLALPLAVFDTVTYTDPTLGWDHKVFRIRKLTTAGIGPVQLLLQEEASANYDWSSGDATVIDPAPDTNLPNPLTVLPAAGLSVMESTYVTRDGAGVKAEATMTWAASPDAFVYQYQPEYQLTTDLNWTILPRTATNTASVLDIAPSTYNFRVKAINTLGVSSIYTTITQQIAGLLAPPTQPQNMTISTIGGLAILRWDASPDLDVRIGGYYEFRHSPTTTDGWANSTSIGNAIPGSHTNTVLPLKPGIYLAKAVDSSSIESTNAASVTTTQAAVLAYANVTSLTEEPGFTGTKTNCFVNGASALTIGGTGIFDGISDLDSVADLDSYGGISASATYLFDGGIDLGSVMRVRLTSHMQASIVNVLDFIDDRTINIDDWTSFDGAIVADADAATYVRSTQTDPSGSPTWTAWNRLDSGEFSARAFQFETILESSDPAYNIQLSQLSVTVDQVT